MSQMERRERELLLGIVTDTWMIIPEEDIDLLCNWLHRRGHAIQSWEGLLKGANNKLTISKELRWERKGGDGMVEQDIDAVKRQMSDAYTRFHHNAENQDKLLLMCVELEEGAGLTTREIGKTFRVLALLLGLVISGMSVAAIVSKVVGMEVWLDWTWVLAMMLVAILMIYSAIIGKTPMFFGDFLWIQRAMVRAKVRNADGTRKWKILQ